MSAIVIDSTVVALVETIEQATKPAAVDILAGQTITLDTAGKWRLALSTTAGNAGYRRAMAVKTVKAGQTVTGLYKGLLDVGNALSALAYGAQVFQADTAGGSDTAAGTVSLVNGIVESAWASGPTTADKILRVNG